MQSTTGILKSNIADILRQEKQELSISTIKEKLRARGVTEYRQGHLAGALRQVLDMPGYTSPGRGCYQYIGSAPAEKTVYSPALKIFEVYSRAVKEASDILNGIDIISSTEAELEEVIALRDIIKETQSLLDRIGVLSPEHKNCP